MVIVIIIITVELYDIFVVPRWQMRDAIKNLSKTPKRRKCWQLSGSLRSNDKGEYHVII